MIDVRVQELRSLIDDITTETFPKKALKFESIKMDFNKLIVAGHSFGGGTAIKAASRDFRVRCVLTLDPYLHPFHEEINSGNFKIPNHVPVLLLNTESFHELMSF